MERAVVAAAVGPLEMAPECFGRAPVGGDHTVAGSPMGDKDTPCYPAETSAAEHIIEDDGATWRERH